MGKYDHRGVRLRLRVRMLKAELHSRTYCAGASREGRNQLITTGYGRSNTRCSSDASAGGSGSAKVSAKTTPYRTPTRFC